MTATKMTATKMTATGMTRAGWMTLIALTWLALPLIGLRYSLVWDQLPARIATHFDGAGSANGWMSPQSSLIFCIVFLATVLSGATLALMRFRKPGASFYVLLGVFYVGIGVFTFMENAILKYNLYGTPIQFKAIILPIPVAVVIATAVFLVSKRGSALAPTTILAEETHASHLWGLALTAPLAIFLAGVAFTPNTVIRLTLAVAGLAMFVAATMAWSGFQYLFSSAGVEVRTLGFRLLSIPKEHIREYAVGKWNMAGGYGIRGLGDSRAYVWGNTGVRIKTNTGDVFLGHREPERIVRDLDLIQAVAQ